MDVLRTKKYKLILILILLFSIFPPFQIQLSGNSIPGDSISDKIPPSITEYEIIEFNGAQIPNLVDEGVIFNITFHNRLIQFELESHPSLQSDYCVYLVNENNVTVEVSAPTIQSFVGTVLGMKTSRVCLTIENDVYIGSIRRGDWYFELSSLSRFTGRSEDSGLCIAYFLEDIDCDQIPTIGLPSVGIEKNELAKSVGLPPPTKNQHRSKSVGNGDLLQCRVVLAAAPSFIAWNPLHWVMEMVSIFNQATDIFGSQVDVALTVAAIVGFTTGFTAAECVDLMEELRERMDATFFVDRRTIPRDLAYLFVNQALFWDGKPVSGAAWDLGLPGELCGSKSYAVGWHPPWEPISWGALLIAHEVGHLFAGIHDDYDYYLWLGLLRPTIMYPVHDPLIQCPLFSDGREDPMKNNVENMRTYSEQRLVGWDYKTFPEGKGVNFRTMRQESQGGTAFHLDTIGYSDSGYHFIAYITDRTHIVGANGEISVNGYFRQSDDFYGSLIDSYRKSKIYVLTEDASSVITSVTILEPTDGTIWHWKEKTITGLTPGQSVRIGIGRRDSWSYDWKLVVEWSYSSVISEWNAMTSPTGRFVHFSNSYSSLHGEGYHLDTIGSSQSGYLFFGVFHQIYISGTFDDLDVRGYFRQDDTFSPALQPGRRKVLLYLLNLDFQIFNSCEILNWQNGTIWQYVEVSIENIPSGSYYVAIGRPDSWSTDWELTTEWKGVLITMT